MYFTLLFFGIDFSRVIFDNSTEPISETSLAQKQSLPSKATIEEKKLSMFHHFKHGIHLSYEPHSYYMVFRSDYKQEPLNRERAFLLKKWLLGKPILCPITATKLYKKAVLPTIYKYVMLKFLLLFFFLCGYHIDYTLFLNFS